MGNKLERTNSLDRKRLLLDLFRVRAQILDEVFHAVFGNKRTDDFDPFLGFQSDYLHPVLVADARRQTVLDPGPHGQDRPGEHVVRTPPQANLQSRFCVSFVV